MRRKTLLGTLFLIILIFQLTAQFSRMDLSVVPSFEFPLGPPSSAGEVLYTMGGTIALKGEVPFSEESPLFGLGSLNYSYIDTTGDSSLSLFRMTMGLGLEGKPADWLSLKLSAGGGWGFGLYKNNWGQNPAALVEASAQLNFNPSFSLGVGGSYSYLHNIYHGAGAAITLSITPGNMKKRAGIFIPEIELDPIFPSIYGSYEDNPFGSLVIENGESGSVRDMVVSVNIPEYMDSEIVCARIPRIEKDGRTSVDVKALFTPEILSVTAERETPLELKVEYKYLENQLVLNEKASLEVLKRNAIRWDDARKAASFVTVEDPLIKNFSDIVSEESRDRHLNAVNEKFRTALALFEAISVYGIDFKVDLQTPFSGLAGDGNTIDTIQFPAEVLDSKWGDSDDLSVLYASLLQSAGIDTAFITVPGHIYCAFALDLHPDSAVNVFHSVDELIFTETDTWIPVEVTQLNEGFLQAWEKGASLWKAAALEGKFFPLIESWQLYAPVDNQSGNKRNMTFSEPHRVGEEFSSEMQKVIFRELSEQVTILQNQIFNAYNKEALINKLGVLYGRYGLYSEAIKQFSLVSEGYTAAMANLGNAYYRNSEPEKAMEFFGKALRRNRNIRTALLGMARILYDGGRKDEAREYYERLNKIAPEFASNYSYLISDSGKENTGRELEEWEE